MTDGSLSIGAFAEVVGACVAVVTLGIGGFAYRMRSLRAELVALQEDRSVRGERQAMATVVLERGLAGTSNSLDFLAGLIQRLYEARTDEVSCEAAMRWVSELRADVDKAWAEARFLVGDEKEQISALQQLVSRLGDEGTTRLLRKAAATGSIGALDPDQVLSAADEIDDRNAA